MTMETKTSKTINFMRYRWWFFFASLGVMALSIFLLLTRGLNYGTDFKGGLTLIYEFKSPLTEREITKVLSGKGLPSFVVQHFGPAGQNLFVIKADLPPTGGEKASHPFTEILSEKYGAEAVTLDKEEFVGPKVGKELRTKGIYAVLWAWILMLIYIGFRFDFYFAPGAIFALIHDVVLTAGAFAISRREVNLTVVAAFLTLIGYSINDTIIVFDRIRENIRRHKGMPLLEIINLSMTQTMTRTIITSLTVFLVVVVLFFRAEGDIQNFAFAMIWGVLAGTYSSIFIATPIFYWLREHGHRFGFKKSPKVVVNR